VYSLLGGQPAAWAQTAPPPPGSATNPRATLNCQLMANGSGNGTGAGAAGVIQLVSAPGLASGGAWAGAETAGKARTRTVNFNFAFSNFDQLLATLQPRPQPTIRYRVDKAMTTVYTAEGGLNGPHMAELSGVLNGSQRGWSWNDSVTQTRLASSAPFSNDWRIDLRLSGQRTNTVLAAPPVPFEQFVRCELPIKR
jgi:hypothetical protein